MEETYVSDKAQDMNYAGFWVRIVAVFITLQQYFVAYVLSDIARDLTSARQVFLPPLVFLGVAFFVNKYTHGKRLLRIKVISADAQTPISNQDLFFRTLLKLLSILPLGIGVFSAIWDKKKRMLHDRLANSYVVYESDSPNYLRYPWLSCVMVLALSTGVLVLAQQGVEKAYQVMPEKMESATPMQRLQLHSIGCMLNLDDKSFSCLNLKDDNSYNGYSSKALELLRPHAGWLKKIEIEATQSELDNLDVLSDMQQLKEFYLDAPNLDFNADVSGLTAVDQIVAWRAKSVDFSSWRHFPQLKLAELQNHRHRQSYHKGKSNYDIANISENKIVGRNDKQLSDFCIDGCPQLETLKVLVSNSWTAASLPALKTLHLFLRSASEKDNKEIEVDLLALEQSPLEELSIFTDNNNLGNLDMLPKMQQLKTIKARGAKLNFDVDMQGLNSLEDIVVHRAKSIDFSGWRHFPQLKSAHLHYVPINLGGFYFLFEPEKGMVGRKDKHLNDFCIDGCPQLENLEISVSSSWTAPHLPALKTLHLFLQAASEEDEVVEIDISALEHSPLEELRIYSDNKVQVVFKSGGENKLALEKFPELKNIHIKMENSVRYSTTPVSYLDIAELSSKSPSLERVYIYLGELLELVNINEVCSDSCPENIKLIDLDATYKKNMPLLLPKEKINNLSHLMDEISYFYDQYHQVEKLGDICPAILKNKGSVFFRTKKLEHIEKILQCESTNYISVLYDGEDIEELLLLITKNKLRLDRMKREERYRFYSQFILGTKTLEEVNTYKEQYPQALNYIHPYNPTLE